MDGRRDQEVSDSRKHGPYARLSNVSECENLPPPLRRALDCIHRALTEKVSNIKLEPGVSGALCHLDHEAWVKAPRVVQDSGEAIEGYVEVTVGATPAV
jgi:hypothetical protein